MIDCDAEYRQARARLNRPDHSGLTRRRFLQAGLAGVGVAALSTGWGGRFARLAEAATPLTPGQGILVVILLGGGNDGFSMVVPASDAAYYSARGPLAIAADTVLPIDSDFGFHPSLPKLAARYRAGHVAAVMGVGYPNPDLSHFSSMSHWMTGDVTGSVRTGWLGRWLDAVGNPDGLTAVAVDSGVPLHMVGEKTAATALPSSLSGAFGAKAANVPDSRMFSALSSFASSATGLGYWGDQLAGVGSRSIALADTVAPLYSPALPTGQLSTQLALVARLINANFGVRAFAVEWAGDFDVHSDEADRYPNLMATLDAGIETFYQELDPAWGSSVALMTFSEFGRRVKANQSGTDHGTASTALVIGDNVAGGLVSPAPSLSKLDHNGNAVSTTDFRSVYATVLEDWLVADSVQVLGSAFPKLELFAAPAQPVSGSSSVRGSGPLAPRPAGAGPGYHLVDAGGTVYSFGGASPFSAAPSSDVTVTGAVVPGGKGAWLARADGAVVPLGRAGYLGDMAGHPLAAPIRGMAATPSGKGYWLLGRDGGVFAFGDASFYGSTGSLRLAKPVVGIAALPSGSGYWFVAADGGVFAFGSAPFLGSLGGRRLTAPIVGMAPTPTGEGYWLVASDGGVFCFGDAGFHGSTGAIRLARPIVDMAVTPSANGYWLVASDGGVFTFGDAVFGGSLAGSPPKHPVVGLLS